jgi:hypothetical protein
MATKTRVVLDLNTRLKVIHASERDKLSVKQIMKMFSVGKTQVYEVLKKKTEISGGKNPCRIIPCQECLRLRLWRNESSKSILLCNYLRVLSGENAYVAKVIE